MEDNFMQLSWEKTSFNFWSQSQKPQDFKPSQNIKDPGVLIFTLHIKCQFLSP